MPRFGHDLLHLADDVNAIAASPDGALLAAGSARGTTVWDAASSRVVAHITEGAYGLVFEGDALLLAYGALYRWRFHDGAMEVVGRSMHAPVAICRATGFVAVKTEDGGASVLSPAGEVVRTVVGIEPEVRSLAFSRDGARLAVGWDGRAQVVELATGKRRDLPVPSSGAGVRVLCLPDPTKVLVARDVSREILLVTIDGAVERSARVGDFDDLAISADGSRIALARYDGLHVLDLDGRELFTVERRGSWSHVAFVGDRVALSRHHAVHLVDPAAGTWAERPPGHDDGVSAIAVAPDATFLVTAACFDDAAHVWTLDGTHFRTLEGDAAMPLDSVSISRGSGRVATTSDGTVRIYDARTGELHDETKLGSGTIAAAYAGDDLVVATASGRVALCDGAGVERKVLRDRPATFDVERVGLAVSKDGAFAAVARAGELVVFDCDSGAATLTRPSKGHPSFAPDAPHLAHHTTGIVEVLRVPDGSIVASLRSPLLESLAMLEDRRVATVPFGASQADVLDLDGGDAATIECDRPVCSVHRAGRERVAIGFEDGSAELRAVPPSPALTRQRARSDELAPVRALLHEIGGRAVQTPYRDAPGALLDDDGCGVHVERAGVRMHLRVVPRGVTLYEVSIAAAESPAPEPEPEPSEAPGLLSRLFGSQPPPSGPWHASVFGPPVTALRVSPGRVTVQVTRSALPDAATFEAWVLGCAARWAKAL